MVWWWFVALCCLLPFATAPDVEGPTPRTLGDAAPPQGDDVPWRRMLMHVFDNPLTHLRADDYQHFAARHKDGRLRLHYRKYERGGKMLYLHHTCLMALGVVTDEVLRWDDYYLRDTGLHSGGVILDIGANVGITSVTLAALYPKAIIYAFEPVKAAALLALHNLVKNRIQNVVLHNVAVNVDGARAVWPSPNSPFCRGLDMAVDAAGITVPQVLAHYKIAHVDFLKLDCEGCEFQVVPTVDFRMVGRMAGEVHPDLCPAALPNGSFVRVVHNMCAHHQSQPWGYAVGGCGMPLKKVPASRRHEWAALVCGKEVATQKRPSHRQHLLSWPTKNFTCPRLQGNQMVG